MADYNKNEMLKTYSKLIPIKSISPDSGGRGESKRADFLEKLLRGWGLNPRRYDYIDSNKVKRSNVVVKYGKKDKTIWILAHIDTVSEGDINLWKTNPFKAVIKNGKIYGRGSEDNGGGIISGLYSLKSMLGKENQLRYNYGLVLAADEETASRYGIQELLKERIFGKADMFIVPDAGNPSGDEIEIAEKSILWLKFSVIGKQVHASRPTIGINAFMEGAGFGLEVCEFLNRKYNKRMKPFATPSTFVMTKHEKNVDSINIIPGKEVFYIDCRILPNYRISDILNDINRLKRNCNAKVTVEVVQEEQAPRPTNPNSEIIRILKAAIKKKLRLRARLVGIGGGTIAAYLRKRGYDAVVWAIESEMAHQPNEYAKIDNIKNMISIFNEIFR